MQTSISIFHILCLGCVTSFAFEGKEPKHKIAKRNAAVLQVAIDQLIQTSSNLKTAYADNDLQTAGDVALTLVESLPVIGDIVYLLTNNPDPSYDFESGLTRINDNLKVLNTNIKEIGKRVEELSKTIDISVIKNQVATDKREISNCYADLLLFLQNPLSKAETDRLMYCYSKFSYVRQIGSILRNDKLTFMQMPIFDQIIDKTGYCDGQRIQNIFGFLLGIYIEGCTAMMTSEVLIYGNTSTTYKEECKTTLKSAVNFLLNLYDRCKKEMCTKYIHVLITIFKTYQTSSIKSQLITKFPWFKFVMVKLRKRVSSGIALYNLHVYNYLTLSSSDVVYSVLIWLPDTHYTHSGRYTYGVGYKEYEADYVYNGNNLHKTTLFGLTQLTGKHDNIHKFPSICSRDVTTPDIGVRNDIQDLPSNLVSENSFAGWKTALIIICLIISLVLIFCLYKWYRRRN